MSSWGQTPCGSGNGLVLPHPTESTAAGPAECTQSRRKQQQQHRPHMNQQVSICLWNCSVDACLPSGGCHHLASLFVPGNVQSPGRYHLGREWGDVTFPLSFSHVATSGSTTMGNGYCQHFGSLCSRGLMRFSSLVSSSNLLSPLLPVGILFINKLLFSHLHLLVSCS